MGYRLGVDLGTTFTAAAIVETGSRKPPSMLGLGNRALQIPSVLYLQENGRFLVGEIAERRGQTDPSRVVREFKRRLGDSVPLMVGGTPFSAEALSARLLSWVVAFATERRGAAPDEVVLTYPANWGPYRRELVDQMIALSGIGPAVICPEPQAAAIQYAAQAGLPPGAHVAVYDLGGGTFDVCVLEKTESGFEILGAPDGIEHLGGVDFDQAVFRHVWDILGPEVEDLDLEGPEGRTALTRLRRDCVESKEALSADVDTVIPVALPGRSTSVRLSRTELETLIRPALHDTIETTARVLRAANVTAEQLTAIVLVGGSSRIPLVSHLLQSRFSRPTALDTHPKHDIALGAVQFTDAQPTALLPPVELPTDRPPVEPPIELPVDRPPRGGSTDRPRGSTDRPRGLIDRPPARGSVDRPSARGRIAGLSARTRWISVLAAASVVVVGVAIPAALVATRDRDSNTPAGGSSDSTTPSASISAQPSAAVGLYGVAASPDGRFTYVSELNSNAVSVIDMRAGRVVKNIAVGSKPLGVAVSQTDGRIYVVNNGSGSVTGIDSTTLTPDAREIRVGRQPQSIVVRPGKDIAYVTNVGDDTVSVLDLAAGEVIKTIPVGDRPLNLAIDPAGHRAYVVNAGSDSVSVISTATNRRIATLPVRKGPHDIAVGADSGLLYLTHNGSTSVSVVDPITKKAVGTPIALGTMAVDLAVGGDRLYATLKDAGAVAAIDTGTRESVGRIPVGAGPAGIAIRNDGKQLYVTTNGTGVVTVIDTETTQTVGTPISVTPSPTPTDATPS